jgi:hypothetical protein
MADRRGIEWIVAMPPIDGLYATRTQYDATGKSANIAARWPPDA